MSGQSLKGFISYLSRKFDMTPAALYERQRALVRAGLLKVEPGRGSGSGVRATPESITMLLIAILAPGGLSETEAQSRAIAKLRSESGKCPLTGKRTFAAALVALFADEGLANRLHSISAHQNGTKFSARFQYRPSEHRHEHGEVSRFGYQGSITSRSVSVSLGGLSLGKVAEATAKLK